MPRYQTSLTGPMRTLIICLTLTVLCGAGCGRGVGGSSITKADVQKMDAQEEKWLTTDPTQEALSWLQQKDGKKRTIGAGMDSAQSVSYVKDLYSHGATKATALTKPGDIWVMDIIVVLPADKANRRYLLDASDAAERDAGQGGGWEQMPDYGQKYALLQW